MKRIQKKKLFTVVFFLIFVWIYSHSSEPKKNEASHLYSFPKDHRAHLGYATEWWYYTGHLKTKKGNYGFELTFFKVDFSKGSIDQVQEFPDWKTAPLYLAHFAVSDLDRKKFFFSEKLNRPIGKIAGANSESYRVWNEDWTVSLLVNGSETNPVHHLKASMRDFSIDLYLKNQKKPVVHGIDGRSWKTDRHYSQYYSLTRMKTWGQIQIQGEKYACQGLSWMDHEWMNHAAISSEIWGWDWWSLQLSDDLELMYYRLRGKEHSILASSSGTFFGKDQEPEHLFQDDVEIQILKTWKSQKSQAVYPIAWRIHIPKKNLELSIVPYFPDQELDTQKSTRILYWEGAVRVEGTLEDQPIQGQGYVEMTGYQKRD